MARGSSDGDFWVPLAEKAFAKLFGTYASMNGGNSEEVWRLINGAPSQTFDPKTYRSDSLKLFRIFQDAFKKEFLIVIAMSSQSLGLYSGHAYALVGAYELKDKSGNVVHRLVRIMNPHGSDGKYNGAWRDSDPRWEGFTT